MLADFGARRELAQSLAEGLTAHIADLRRRLPGADRLVVQVDEPALPAVLGGGVPTASGFHRHRSVDLPEASQALGWVVDAVTGAGAEPWVHSCAKETPLDLLRGAGARGLSVDHTQLSARDHDELAAALDAGETVALGVVPSTAPPTPPSDAQVTESVLRWLEMLGLDPEQVGDHLVLTPACGLAGASPHGHEPRSTWSAGQRPRSTARKPRTLGRTDRPDPGVGDVVVGDRADHRVAVVDPDLTPPGHRTSGALPAEAAVAPRSV